MDNILEFEPNEVIDKQSFKKELFDELVIDYECNMDTYCIKTAEHALLASFDVKTLFEELTAIENF